MVQWNKATNDRKHIVCIPRGRCLHGGPLWSALKFVSLVISNFGVIMQRQVQWFVKCFCDVYAGPIRTIYQDFINKSRTATIYISARICGYTDHAAAERLLHVTDQLTAHYLPSSFALQAHALAPWEAIRNVEKRLHRLYPGWPDLGIFHKTLGFHTSSWDLA